MNKYFSIFATSVGSSIGWGAFVLPSVFLLTSGLLNTIIGLYCAALLVCVINYSYANSNGINENSKISDTLLLAPYALAIPLNATAIPLVFEKVYPNYSEMNAHSFDLIGIQITTIDFVVSLAFVVLFFFGAIKKSNALSIQGWVVTVLLMSVFGLLAISSFNVLNDAEINYGTIDLRKILLVVAIAPWAFAGFEGAYEVTSNRNRNGLVLTTSMAIITSASIYAALTTITAFGIQSISKESEWALGESVGLMYGHVGVVAVGIAMLASILAGLNGFYTTSSLLTTKIINVTRTKALFVILSVSAFCLLFGRDVINTLVSMSSLGISLAYTIVAKNSFNASTSQLQKSLSLIGIVLSLVFSSVTVSSLIGVL